MAVKLGVICHDNWTFFKSIYDELAKTFEVRSYDGHKTKSKIISGHKFINRSIDRHLYDKRNIKEIMKWSDVTFFEWASNFLEIGTHQQKKSPIAARLHRYEAFEFADRIDWSKLDKLVFVGDGMRRWALERIDIDKASTAVIHNTIDTDKFKPHSRRTKPTYKIGIVGAVIPRKRVYELVIAFKELKAVMRKEPLKLSIVGSMDGEYPEFIKALIKNLKLEDSVNIEGRVEDIVKWYNSVDIIVGNSMHESAHVTLQEGRACGCYPLSHRWDGIEEFLEPEQIFLTNTDFCEKVQSYYAMPEVRREKYRKQGRAFVEKNYSLQVITEKYQKLFNSMLEK